MYSRLFFSARASSKGVRNDFKLTKNRDRFENVQTIWKPTRVLINWWRKWMETVKVLRVRLKLTHAWSSGTAFQIRLSIYIFRPSFLLANRETRQKFVSKKWHLIVGTLLTLYLSHSLSFTIRMETETSEKVSVQCTSGSLPLCP